MKLLKVCSLALLLLAACGGEKTHTIHGTISAPTCTEGYAIGHASVIVRDEAGKIVGSSTTSKETGSALTLCVASFTVQVGEAKFYSFKIGTHDGPAFSKADLEKDGWKVDLSLG